MSGQHFCNACHSRGFEPRCYGWCSFCNGECGGAPDAGPPPGKPCLCGKCVRGFENPEPQKPMRGEVGYTGDIEELLEYPCNCTRCRNVADDRHEYHDGETDWERCVFCSRHFAIEDTLLIKASDCPYISGDALACASCNVKFLLCMEEQNV